jgi:hypothetical protein
VSERFRPLYLYARVHHIHVAVFTLGVINILYFFIGSQVLVLPTGSVAGTIEISVKTLLLVILSSVIVIGTSSALSSIEMIASAEFQRIRSFHLLIAIALGALPNIAIELLSSSSQFAIEHVRSLIIWLGLAMISGYIFGLPLAWILPLMSVFPLTYFGFDDLGEPHWWTWIMQSESSLLAWSLAVAIGVMGLAAQMMRPWLLYPAARLVTLRRRSDATPGHRGAY